MTYEAGRPAPRRPRAQRLPPAARRSKLLEAALHVFARRGLGAVRHVDVAEQGGVSASTVFVYFPTREALRDAVLDEVARFLIEMSEEIHARSEPAPELLLALTRAFARSVETHPDHARVWLDWSTAIRDAVWPRYLELQERIVARIAEIIRRGQREGDLPAGLDAENDARLIVGSAHMIAQMMFTHQPPEQVDRFLRALVTAAVGAPLPEEPRA